VKFDTLPLTPGIASCRLVAGCAAPSAARERAVREGLAAMDDIDVTSCMGRDLPCMCNVVEATTMVSFERNLAHKQVSRGGGAASWRAVRIGRSLQVLRDGLLRRFGVGCVTRSDRVGDEAAPRLRPDADRAGVRGGRWRRPGVRRGGDEAVGRAGSPRLGSPPDQSPRFLEV
jgi:hypothetical protein